MMSRGRRQAPGGQVYHVLNRAVARLPLFEKPADYDAFVRMLAECLDERPMRVLAFVLMPNHWHFVLWPESDGELTDFCRWLAHTPSMRWHAHYHSSGTGHIYQGRYQAFVVEGDENLYTSAATWSATRCGPAWCSGPKTGAGLACGGGSTGMSNPGVCSRLGRCPCPRIGPRG
jgi:REP element-mobilizing transposase RayT